MPTLSLLFTDALALAIAEGRKTVTRRPITRANSLCDGWSWTTEGWNAMDWTDAWIDGGPSPAGNAGPYLHVARPNPEHKGWRADGSREGTRHRVYCRHAPGDTLVVREAFNPHYFGVEKPAYRADWDGAAADVVPKPRWTPSIHMPRWAARSVRRIMSVTPELMDHTPLSEAEALREGFGSSAEFGAAWLSIYGARPRWVWRYEFSAENVRGM